MGLFWEMAPVDSAWFGPDTSMFCSVMDLLAHLSLARKQYCADVTTSGALYHQTYYITILIVYNPKYGKVKQWSCKPPQN